MKKLTEISKQLIKITHLVMHKIAPKDLSIGEMIVPRINPEQIVPIRLTMVNAMTHTKIPATISATNAESKCACINVCKTGMSQNEAMPAKIHAIIDDSSRMNPFANPIIAANNKTIKIAVSIIFIIHSVRYATTESITD